MLLITSIHDLNPHPLRPTETQLKSKYPHINLFITSEKNNFFRCLNPREPTISCIIFTSPFTHVLFVQYSSLLLTSRTRSWGFIWNCGCRLDSVVGKISGFKTLIHSSLTSLSKLSRRLHSSFIVSLALVLYISF